MDNATQWARQVLQHALAVTSSCQRPRQRPAESLVFSRCHDNASSTAFSRNCLVSRRLPATATRLGYRKRHAWLGRVGDTRCWIVATGSRRRHSNVVLLGHGKRTPAAAAGSRQEPSIAASCPWQVFITQAVYTPTTSHYLEPCQLSHSNLANTIAARPQHGSYVKYRDN